MKKILLLTTSCLVCGIIIGLSFNASAQESQSIPSWVKKTAKFWVDGDVGDADFIKAIQWMVTNGIIVLPNNVSPNSNGQTTSTQPINPLSVKLPTGKDMTPYGYQLKGTPVDSEMFNQNGATESIEQTYVKSSISPQTRLVLSIGTYGDKLTALKEHDAIYATLTKNGYQSTIRSSYAFASGDGSNVFCSSQGLSGLQGSAIMYDFCVSDNTLYLFEFDVNYNADHNLSSDLTGIEANFFHVDKSVILG